MCPYSPLHRESTPGLPHAESLLTLAVVLPVCECVLKGFRLPRPFPTWWEPPDITGPLPFFCSITLGGFGADRFYLGQWREGLGKLFSFGGLGIWTLIDVLLIGVGYVGPADGSLYI